MYSITVKDADSTRLVGKKLARHLCAGDLILLSGGLGAGKTTFTQGIGEGLGVRGHVSSPTFIVARVHQPGTGSLPLIHADAYRIADLADLETLDLESSLPESVTVIEWGEGKTEFLSDDRLEIEVRREQGAIVPDENGIINLEEVDNGERTIVITPYGSRWQNIDLQALLA